MEPPATDVGQAWAEVEAQQLGDRHGEVREAVAVDGQTLELGYLLLQHAFDGGTGLAPVEHDRLIVDDRPLVQVVGVGSHGGRSPPRLDPGGPQVPGRVQARHGSDEHTSEVQSLMRISSAAFCVKDTARTGLAAVAAHISSVVY